MSGRVDQLSEVKRALLDLKEVRARFDELKRSRNEPIAIIGLGCRLPGNCDSPESYWNLLRDGVVAVSASDFSPRSCRAGAAGISLFSSVAVGDCAGADVGTATGVTFGCRSPTATHTATASPVARAGASHRKDGICHQARRTGGSGVVRMMAAMSSRHRAQVNACSATTACSLCESPPSAMAAAVSGSRQSSDTGASSTEGSAGRA